MSWSANRGGLCPSVAVHHVVMFPSQIVVFVGNWGSVAVMLEKERPETKALLARGFLLYIFMINTPNLTHF